MKKSSIVAVVAIIAVAAAGLGFGGGYLLKNSVGASSLYGGCNYTNLSCDEQWAYYYMCKDYSEEGNGEWCQKFVDSKCSKIHVSPITNKSGTPTPSTPSPTTNKSTTPSANKTTTSATESSPSTLISS